MKRWPAIVGGMIAVAIALFLGACRTPRDPVPHAAEARDLFNKTVKEYHLPSATAHGEARDRLLEQAATGYEAVISHYGDVPEWASQAMRSLGNVRVEQKRSADAVKLYDRVVSRYPQQEWEVLQSLKSAGDLLWDDNQKPAAIDHYRQIIMRFDRPDEPPVVKIVVRNAHKRMDSAGQTATP